MNICHYKKSILTVNIPDENAIRADVVMTALNMAKKIAVLKQTIL